MSALDGKTLVVAFEGWNDAGDAASTAAKALITQRGLRPTRAVDPELYYDFQFTRPTIATGDDGTRVITWPGAALHAPEDGRGLHVLVGAEPARSWQAFAAEIVDAALAADIDTVVFLGALLADVPHTRAIGILTSSENEAMRARLDVQRSHYEGPVGILSIIGQAAEASGLSTVSLWASVPHYVHNSPSPKAALALLDSITELTGAGIDREALVAESARWEDGVNALAADDEEMAAYIAQLERARDTVESPEASGEAIAREFERYLHPDSDNGKSDGKHPDER